MAHPVNQSCGSGQAGIHNKNMAALPSGSAGQESFIDNVAGLYQQAKSNGTGACVFTKEQYKKLIQMINKNQSGSSSSANLNANAASCEVLP
ncbi:hypothetical protein HAX54_011824, partial [Datura stramonium]|nr:hypothetical protein [Datura stramonium]